MKFLVIIRRYLGDVLLASPLVGELKRGFPGSRVDLLINASTLPAAEMIHGVDRVLIYQRPKNPLQRFIQEARMVASLWKRYDYAFSLTSNTRSTLYAVIGGRKSVGVAGPDGPGERIRRIFLDVHQEFDPGLHTVAMHARMLQGLGIQPSALEILVDISSSAHKRMASLLHSQGIQQFILFHPSAQYEYKIYPAVQRNKLFRLLKSLDLPIVTTGSSSLLDKRISEELPRERVLDLTGRTSLHEFGALCRMARCYIGMDTFNTHLAAALNTRVFAIYGPTLLSRWSPWSNELQRGAIGTKPIQTYGRITIFQAVMDCVPCGKAGCDDQGGQSVCLGRIEPESVFEEVRQWLSN